MKNKLKGPKEVDIQSRCVTAMRELGAFAQKCSNRFLVGVPDLLCQMPTFPTSYWEVKRGYNYTMPDPTPKQKLWLRDFTRAGGFCGVIYFVNSANDVYVTVQPSTLFDLNDMDKKWTVSPEMYAALPRGSKMAAFKEALMQAHHGFKQEASWLNT